MIRVSLFDDTDEALASGNIDTFSACVEVQVVGVAHTRNTRNRRTAIRVQHYELRWFSGHYKEATVGFVQRKFGS